MNIIEALVQAVDKGKLVTNTSLKRMDLFLKYSKDRAFSTYRIDDDGITYKFETRDFSLGEILDIGWEVVKDKWELT